MYYMQFRGYTFRNDIGEVRSIIPSNVPVMALTATATKKVRTEVSRDARGYTDCLITVPVFYMGHIYRSAYNHWQMS